MTVQDAVVEPAALEALFVEGSGRDRWYGADERAAREVLVALRAQRARFAPGSAHPVAMMLDEWIGRLEAHAARPLLPVPA